MRILKGPLLLILLSVILPATGKASVNSSISGVVRDQNGDVIEGARVEARKLPGGAGSAAKSDAGGRYEIRGLGPGQYRILVSRAGFTVGARAITLSASQQHADGIDFVLAPGTIEDTVTVTIGKGIAIPADETPNAVRVTSAADIEARRPSSVAGALAGVPNLTTIGANPLAARIRLRGLTSNRVLMIVDGERLNNVRTDPASGISPSTIDVMQLESIEVVSGSGSSLYGSDAIAGTINLVSKEPVVPGHGRYLGLRVDADITGNGHFRRGTPTINFSTAHFAVRASGSVFAGESYRAGGRAITRGEVASVANFSALLSNAVGTGAARSFAVWELPANGKVENGQAHGFYGQFDAWLMPSPKHRIRYRQLNNQHKNIGFAFLSPPFDSRLQYNGFRRLDKYSARYEGRELTKWQPRLTAGFYAQKYVFPDDTLTYSIDEGSSWSTNPQGLPVITGNLSAFTPSSFTDSKSSVLSYCADIQATFDLFHRARLTTGLGYLLDSSTDSFARQDFSAAVTPAQRNISGRASTPRSLYENVSWTNLAEFDPAKFLRLNASLRVDSWRTRARPTPGFPVTTESLILNASFDQLSAAPGAIDLAGISGIRGLIGGSVGLRTRKTSVTGSIAALLKLPYGMRPYYRWETSYREPGITERYILRNFGSRTFSLLLAPNTALKPERGSISEAGLKIEQLRWRATVSYFRNELRDFIGNEFSGALFIPPDPQNGLDPVSPFFPFHGVLYVQRANTARARIQGVEASYEASLALGRMGSITPFGTLGWLKGSNLAPDDQTVTLIRDFYNRDDTLVPLRGTAADAPLAGITPFSANLGFRYSDRRGGWTGEYNVRFRARVKRADPTDLTASIGTQYGTFASQRPSVVDSLKAGYAFTREKYRVLIAGGADNIGNKLYFDPFQTSPAPGRSFTAGITIEGFDLWKR